jgi:hypothetical protein
MNETTHLQYSTNGVKQPTMRIDLLLVFSFQYKDDLDGNKIIRIVAVRQNKLRSRIH